MGAIAVVTQGQTLLLKSSSSTIYSDAALSTSITLPFTFAGDTTVYAPDGAQLAWTMFAGGVAALNVPPVISVSPGLTVTVAPVTAASAASADNTRTPFLGGYTPADHGLISWTFAPDLGGGSGTAMTPGGTVFFQNIYIPAGTVTNILAFITTGGGTLTASQCLAGLFDVNKVLLSATASQHTAWQSTGVITMALSSPQTVTAGMYKVGYFYNGTTGPTFAAQAPTTSAFLNFSLAAAQSRAGTTSDTGRTTTFPATLGTQTAGARTTWFAVN